MKFSNIWTVLAGALIVMGCVSCGSGGSADSGTAMSPSVASTTTDPDAVAAWYVKARQ